MDCGIDCYLGALAWAGLGKRGTAGGSAQEANDGLADHICRATNPVMSIRRRSLLPGTEGRHTTVRIALTGAESLRAVAALARARLEFARCTPAELLENNRRIAAIARTRDVAVSGDDERVAQVSYVVTRMARYSPWRTDCLVQALAAQKWLASEGIATNLVIGVDTLRPQGFHAHAWLTYGDDLVTGSNTDGYEALLK